MPLRLVPAVLLGVEVAVRPPYAYERCDPLLRVPLDVLTAIASLLIVVGTPCSGLSSSTPSYCDGFRRIDGVKPDERVVVRLAPLADCVPCVIGCVSRGAILVKVVKQVV